MDKYSFLLLVIAAFPASGQQFEFGVKVGIPITDSFQTSSFFSIDFGEGATSATRRYVVGPTVGLRLTRGLGMEFDALYGRLGFDMDTKSSGVSLTHTRTTASSWEFPVLGKYSLLRMPVVKPFVDGGISFRRTSGISSTTVTSIEGVPPFTQSSSTNDPSLANRSWYGGVIGLGAEARVGRVRISPEFRYTRWAVDRHIDVNLHSNQNEVVFLLGMTL